MAGCREHIIMQVSLVVAAVDEFYGRPVKSKLRVWIEGERPPVDKQDGYFVFINIKNPHIVLHVEGPQFYPQRIELEADEIDKYPDRTLKVRLLPNHSYPIPYHTTCVEGHAPAGSAVMAYNHEYNEPFKLLNPYAKKSPVMEIFHPETMDLEGKTLIIQNKEGTKDEVFGIVKREAAEKAIYQITPPPQNDYKKIGTKIFPVYVSVADKNGEFYLPIANLNSEKTKFTFWLSKDGNREQQLDIELAGGRLNRIDFN